MRYLRPIAEVWSVGLVLAAVIGLIGGALGLGALDAVRLGLLATAFVLTMYSPMSAVHDIVIDGVMGQQQRRPSPRPGDRDMDGIDLGWLGVLLFASIPMAALALTV